MKVFISNFLIINFIFIVAIVLPPSISAEDSCFVDIFSNDLVTIKLYERESCEYSVFDGKGFIILSEFKGNEKTKIYWGESFIDADQSDYLIFDLDQDGIHEALTLFSSSTTVWGYVHKFLIIGSNEVSLQSVKIPDSVCMKIDYNGLLEANNNAFLIYDNDIDNPNYIKIIYNDTEHKFQFNYIDK